MRALALTTGLALGALPALAAAEHAHHHHGDGAPSASPPRSTFGASLGLLAASYRHVLYEGDYQGLTAGATWSGGRFSASAELSGYRLTRNGATLAGIGDLMLHGMATVVDRGPLSAGAMLMVGVPTGDADAGLGMGHVMLMPRAWGMLAHGRTSLMTAVGYSRGLGDASAHATHGGGLWPLVEPMTMSELTATVQVDRMLGSALGLGARAATAIPLEMGDLRVVGALRAVWLEGRFQTSAELQVGVTRDPLGVRGVMQTTASF